MSKSFQIQAKFGNTWIIIKSVPYHKDALDYISKKPGLRYPMRIVRVVKTIVFSEEKNKEKK